MKLNTTCDVCKTGTDDLGFDDVHKGMQASSWLYAFLCRECREINDAFWNLSGVSLSVELEITMNKRAFNRHRKELRNV